MCYLHSERPIIKGQRYTRRTNQRDDPDSFMLLPYDNLLILIPIDSTNNNHKQYVSYHKYHNIDNDLDNEVRVILLLVIRKTSTMFVFIRVLVTRSTVRSRP